MMPVLFALRLRIVFACMLGLTGFGSASVCSQESQPETPEQSSLQNPSPEYKSLSELLTETEESLRAAPSLQVEIDTTLESVSDTRTTSQLRLTYLSRGPAFRMEVREEPSDRLQLLVLYRDSELLRWAATANQFSRTATEEPYGELQSCGMSHWYLDLFSANYLVMPEPSEVFFSKITQVVDLGTDSRGRHFRLTCFDGNVADWWFSTKSPRLPIAMKNEKTLALADGRTIRQSQSTEFKWTLDKNLEDVAFEFELPGSAKQVDDLAASVSGRGVEQLIGQPLPQLNLIDLQAQPASVEPNERPMLLYFWATWAAPSVEQLPGVLEFAETLEARGVQIRLINVAETPEQIARFLKELQFNGQVLLDHDGNAAHELRLTNLPAVVVITGDQKIRSIYQKVNAESRPAISAAVEKILAAPK